MKKLVVIALLGMSASFALTGCGSSGGGSASAVAPLPTEKSPGGAWVPQKVSIKCSSGDCPQGVGAAMFVGYKNGQAMIGRCTTSLINSTQILMNAHCDKEFTPKYGFYFFNVNGQTQYIQIDLKAGKALDVFDYTALDAPDIGVGEDLEIWNLTQSLQGTLQPRAISRQIPADMSHLTAFVINNPINDFMVLHLDKEDCATSTHTPDDRKGGTADDSVGLELLCKVIPGNSGSPAFMPNDFSTIQVVINAGNASEGYGNRIQCLANIPGLPDPSTVCTRAFPPESAALKTSSMSKYRF